MLTVCKSLQTRTLSVVELDDLLSLFSPVYNPFYPVLVLERTQPQSPQVQRQELLFFIFLLWSPGGKFFCFLTLPDTPVATKQNLIKSHFVHVVGVCLLLHLPAGFRHCCVSFCWLVWGLDQINTATVER